MFHVALTCLDEKNEIAVSSRALRKTLTDKYALEKRFELEEEADAVKRFVSIVICLQCFDAVGWAAGRASGP